MSTPMLTATLLFAEREQTGDVIFVIGKKRIRAHKNVLAAFSPKYKAQFYGSKRDKGEIHVQDISADAFEEFIKFFYGETVKFTLENVESILNQAKQCLINSFINECELFLIGSLNEKNEVWSYRLSLFYDLETLQDICEQKIRLDVPKLFSTTDFLECEQFVLAAILSLEPFVDCKESVIFEGCISWARAACQRKNIDDKSTKNLRAQLNGALGFICFGSFNIYKFVEINESYKGFFTPDEFIEITNIIGDLKNFKSANFNQKVRKHLTADENGTQQNSGSTGSSGSSGRKRRRDLSQFSSD